MLLAVRISFVAIVLAGCGFKPRAADTDGNATGDTVDTDGASAWLAPWSHRKTITFLASQVEAPNNLSLAGFPVVIVTNDGQITNGLKADGSDLVFTSDDATTPLDHELESFVSGQLVTWVKIPSLSASVDTKIYVYYGNPAATAPAPEPTWSAAFLAVYHLQQDPGPGNPGDIRDATSNHHDGTAESTMTGGDSVAGQIGKAMHFDGSNDHIGVPSTDLGNAFTISMWMNMQNDSGIHSLLSNSPDNSNTNGFRFFANTNGSNDHQIHVETGDGGSSNTASTPTNAVAPSQWTHIATIVDRTQGSATIVINGQIATTDTTILNDFSTVSDFEIGRMETNNPFPGLLDEVELASTLRPIEWLRTAYNNQRTPASFYTIGTEETR